MANTIQNECKKAALDAITGLLTAGTITKYALRTSGAATRINGTVGTSGADLIVTDNVIPPGATQVSCSGGITLTLQLS